MIKQIKRKLIYDIMGQEAKYYALAFELAIINYLPDGVMEIRDYSVNKIHALTGMHHTTIEKYMKKLLSLGWAYFEKKADGKRTLRLRRVTSGTKHRNIPINTLIWTNIIEAAKSLRNLIIMFKEAFKETVAVAIRIANNPKKHPKDHLKDDSKAARKFCKNHNLQNPETGAFEYQEKGISVPKLAQLCCCSERTIKSTTRNAAHLGLYHRKHYYRYDKILGVCYRPVFGYDFTLTNAGCKILHANTYPLGKEWRDILVNKLQFMDVMDDNEIKAYNEKQEEHNRHYRQLWLQKQYEMEEESEEYFDWLRSKGKFIPKKPKFQVYDADDRKSPSSLLAHN